MILQIITYCLNLVNIFLAILFNIYMQFSNPKITCVSQEALVWLFDRNYNAMYLLLLQVCNIYWLIQLTIFINPFLFDKLRFFCLFQRIDISLGVMRMSLPHWVEICKRFIFYFFLLLLCIRKKELRRKRIRKGMKRKMLPIDPS